MLGALVPTSLVRRELPTYWLALLCFMPLSCLATTLVGSRRYCYSIFDLSIGIIFDYKISASSSPISALAGLDLAFLT